MAIHYKYFDDVLIKLRRTYKKDEYVSFLHKKLSKTEIELGKANSYIQELEDKVKNFGMNKELNKQCKLDELYLMRSNENKNLRSELKKTRDTNRELICEIVKLKNL